MRPCLAKLSRTRSNAHAPARSLPSRPPRSYEAVRLPVYLVRQHSAPYEYLFADLSQETVRKALVSAEL